MEESTLAFIIAMLVSQNDWGATRTGGIQYVSRQTITSGLKLSDTSTVRLPAAKPPWYVIGI